MKLKSMFSCLLAAAVTFCSCSKDEQNGQPDAQIGSVRITVAPGESSRGTRAEAGKVENNDPIALGEGYIFFTNLTGVIVRHVEIVDGVAGTGQVSLSTLTSVTGETISDVSTSATNCYIFSKIPSSVTLPTLTDNQTNISQIKALAMEVTDLTDSGNGVTNVPLWGEGTVNNTTDPMTVNVQLYAMGARIQIEKLTGYQDIEDFQLEGIFINNFYRKMNAGYGAPDAIINHGSNVNVYIDGSAEYALYPSLYDYQSTGLASMSGTVATPTVSGNVWAYNIWPTEGTTAPTTATMPHIIFVLSGVVYDNNGTSVTINETLYLTVKGMTANATAVEKIEKGNSYTFGDIRFQFSDLELVPEVRSVDAVVTITQNPWKDTAVEPVI